MEGLRGVNVAAVAMSFSHILVAAVGGDVWAFGDRIATGLGDPDAVSDEDVQDLVLEPAPIPVLCVRARTSPDVLPLR